MNHIWSLSIDDYLEIVRRAKEGGVLPGESIEKYLIEYMKEKEIQPIGATELTKEEYIEEVISHDKKILSIETNNDGKSEIKIHQKNNEEPPLTE
ncbi:MAG: hypothetical protein AABY22_13515 [Nanoarchaeota archaeon]